MVPLKALRSPGVAVVAALAYLLLLRITYTAIADAYAAPWAWVGLQPRGSFFATAWFSALDVVAAIVAALPVGLALARWGEPIHRLWAVLPGLVAGVWVAASSLASYGTPERAAVWLMYGLQFLAIGLAPLLVFSWVSGRRPKGTRSRVMEPE